MIDACQCANQKGYNIETHKSYGCESSKICWMLCSFHYPSILFPPRSMALWPTLLDGTSFRRLAGWCMAGGSLPARLPPSGTPHRLLTVWYLWPLKVNAPGKLPDLNLSLAIRANSLQKSSQTNLLRRVTIDIRCGGNLAANDGRTLLFSFRSDPRDPHVGSPRVHWLN